MAGLEPAIHFKTLCGRRHGWPGRASVASRPRCPAMTVI